MKIFAYSVREDEEKYFEEFCEQGLAECHYTSDYPNIDNLKLADGCDAVSIITNIITEEMYQTWYDMGVRYIATRSVGYEHINAAFIKKIGMKGIVHATYSPNAVANYTIMLMLMACRKVNFILDKARMQDFSLPGKIGKEISLCTVGIIGTGAIGETLIRHLSGFGCRILANDVYEKDSLKAYCQYVDLDTLYRESDIVSLHVPGTKENYHMINADSLSIMKDDVIIINAARGLLVDSYALIDALETGKVGFAALDTFEEELALYYKNLERTKLANRVRAIFTSMPNVILSPHMAFYTEQSTADMVGTTLRGLYAFESGEEDIHKIYL